MAQLSFRKESRTGRVIGVILSVLFIVLLAVVRFVDWDNVYLPSQEQIVRAGITVVLFGFILFGAGYIFGRK